MNERQQEADFATLQRLMVNLVQSQAGRRMDPKQAWLNDAQTLSTKLFGHLVSLLALTAAHRVGIDDDRSFEFIDHASAKVVARAAFETYLVFFFIFGGSDRARSEFRHKIWRYGGLVDRQKSHASTPETRAVKASEKLEMERLVPEIESSPHFAAYDRAAAKKILKGEWRGGDSWAALGEHAGFPESYFRNVYGYLCGYSHASYISAMQIGQARSLDDQRALASFCIGIGIVLMAHFARAYTALFDDLTPVLDADQEGKAAVARWCINAESWAKALAKQEAR